MTVFKFSLKTKLGKLWPNFNRQNPTKAKKTFKLGQETLENMEFCRQILNFLNLIRTSEFGDF